MNVLEREQAQLARLRELRDQIVTALTGEAVEIAPDITFGELAAVLPEKIDEAIRQGTGGIRAREGRIYGLACNYGSSSHRSQLNDREL